MHIIRKVAALAAAVTACTATVAMAAGAPSVIAMNQKIANGEVSITYANMPKDGFLVIHASSASGKATGDVLGEVALKAGDHRNIKVKVNGSVARGATLWAELQPAKDSTKAFEDAGLPVEQSFKAI